MPPGALGEVALDLEVSVAVRVDLAGGGIGNVTGQGLTSNIKDRYSLRTLRVLVALLAAAKVINAASPLTRPRQLQDFRNSGLPRFGI